MNESLFQDRIDTFENQEKQLKYKSFQLSIFRIIIFLIGSIITYLLFPSFWAICPLILFVVLFIIIIQQHNKVKTKKLYFKTLGQVNKDELNRTQFTFDYLETGEEFKDNKHPYSGDLDLFGKKSLFQLINRTGTFIGKKELASWLQNHHSSNEILSMQKAIEEMEAEIDWRQDFETYGKMYPTEQGEIQALRKWVQEEPIQINKWTNITKYILPILTVVSIVLAIVSAISYIIPITFIFINFSLLAQYRKKIEEIRHTAPNQVKALKTYLYIFQMIEEKKLNNELLKEWQNDLFEQKASNNIQKLFNYFHSLDISSSPVWAIIGNGVFMWDIHYFVLLNKWKKRNAPFVDNWLNCLAKFDMINSLAGYNYINDNATVPTLNNEIQGIKAKNIKHPLLKDCKKNPTSIYGIGKVHIITGSNMSGKSTYLRTVGTNLLLAQLGLKVSAESFEFSNLRIFSSMRTQDSLQENTSAFYAELLRLKQLIELTKEHQNVFFLLDEILKGTNSKDRYKGAKGLIKQLSKLNAIGFISTHDLALSELIQISPKIENYSFNSTIEDKEIIFDYQLTEGVCNSFNASQLMKNIGIELD
ncbi:MAG: hypothetical protein GY827_02450 [Cytophagales bacterium]|nr:hypothetical protein [Cytophagales bacterium]